MTTPPDLVPVYTTVAGRVTTRLVPRPEPAPDPNLDVLSATRPASYEDTNLKADPPPSTTEEAAAWMAAQVLAGLRRGAPQGIALSLLRDVLGGDVAAVRWAAGVARDAGARLYVGEGVAVWWRGEEP